MTYNGKNNNTTTDDSAQMRHIATIVSKPELEGYVAPNEERPIKYVSKIKCVSLWCIYKSNCACSLIQFMNFLKCGGGNRSVEIHHFVLYLSKKLNELCYVLRLKVPSSNEETQSIKRLTLNTDSMFILDLLPVEFLFDKKESNLEFVILIHIGLPSSIFCVFDDKYVDFMIKCIHYACVG